MWYIVTADARYLSRKGLVSQVKSRLRCKYTAIEHISINKA